MAGKAMDGGQHHRRGGGEAGKDHLNLPPPDGVLVVRRQLGPLIPEPLEGSSREGLGGAGVCDQLPGRQPPHVRRIGIRARVPRQVPKENWVVEHFTTSVSCAHQLPGHLWPAWGAGAWGRRHSSPGNTPLPAAIYIPYQPGPLDGAMNVMGQQ